MRRALFIAGVVLVLLILDPTRNLTPIFALMALAIVLAWVLPRFVQPKKCRRDAGACSPSGAFRSV